MSDDLKNQIEIAKIQILSTTCITLGGVLMAIALAMEFSLIGIVFTDGEQNPNFKMLYDFIMPSATYLFIISSIFLVGGIVAPYIGFKKLSKK